MDHCLRKGVTEGLQEVRAKPAASPTRNCMREHEALQAVAVARLPLCTASHISIKDCGVVNWLHDGVNYTSSAMLSGQLRGGLKPDLLGSEIGDCI